MFKRPPPPPPDSALALRESLLRTMLLYILVLAVLYGMIGLFLIPSSTGESSSFFFATRGPILFVSLALTSAISYVVLRFGHVTTAAIVFLVTQGFAITTLAVTAGGVGAAAFSGYMCIVLMAGLLFGLRGGLLSAALCLAVMAFLLYAGTHSMLPPSRVRQHPSSLFTTYTVYLGWIALLVFQYTRIMDSAHHRLGERVKELTALHNATLILQQSEDINGALQDLANLIPPGYQFPEYAAARVRLGEVVAASPGFTESPFHQQAEFETSKGLRGSIEVIYRPEFKERRGQETFLPEERALLDTLTKLLRGTHDRRVAQGALRESEAHLRNIFDTVRDTLYQLSLEGTIDSLNPAFEVITGWKREEWVGRRFDDLVHPEDFPKAFENFRRAVEGRESPLYEMRIRTKSGAYVNGEFLGVPLLKEGKVVGVLGTARDTTERRRLEAQVQRSQRLDSIGTLAGGIAHDLNNVLTPILLATGMLQKGPQDERSSRILSSINAAAMRGAGIVKQVLTFARGGAGEARPQQLRHLAEEMEAFVRQTFPRNLEIRFNIPTDLPPVLGDPTQIHQILLNLCVNARDAMPGGGVLVVTARTETIGREDAASSPDAKPGSYVVLSVSDTGSGIPPEIQAKIFDPFFTTKAEGLGTGLGLSTTLALVRTHDGFIRLISGQNKGTEFSVYFPALGGSEEIVAAEKPIVPMGNGEIILIVDDEQASLYFIREILEAGGYSVRMARDGAEGFVVYCAAETGSISLVITDIDMPRMSGIELAERVHGQDASQRILVTSGSSSPDRIAKSHAFGSFLPKPYTPDELLASVGKMILG